MTKRLRLLCVDADVLAALEAAPERFQSVYRARLDEAVRGQALEAVRQTLDLARRIPREPTWGGYLIIDEDLASVVGIGGFRAGPQPDGAIEMAYCTFPPFEGRGYATATAGRLVELASSSPAVRCVIAHTLPERNASTRILEKNGLRFAGEVIDPEDGRVWRWEKIPPRCGT